MKLKAIVLAALLSMTAPAVFAQFQNPNIENFGPPEEKFLAAPDPAEGVQLIPAGIDLYAGNDDNTIHYGLTPPNSSNKPVLVFVHGYASNASAWYTGKDNMYHDVYQDGYRTAFVSLTPNRHMWTNGFMLANIIDRITQHYGVADVVVVGWSKGGVDTDAALTHFGANSKVSEVFTLSSPHQGTALAELANSWLLSLANIIFMQNNDATRCLTRGYMSYFRSITDPAPGNTVSFTTFGAWGNGPLSRLAVPQGILHAAGGSRASGGNDGVVPYISSKRPNSRELFSGQRKAYGWLGIPYYPGPAETNLDHFEITRGDLVWPYIKGVIDGTLRTTGSQVAADFNPNDMTRSNAQLVTNQPGMNEFVVEAGVSTVWLEIQGASAGALAVWNPEGAEVALLPLEQQNEGARSYRLAAPMAGTYTLEADKAVAALVHIEEGVQARLTTTFSAGTQVCAENGVTRFALDLEGSEATWPEDLVVSGVLHRSSGLDLVPTAAEPPHFVRFVREGDHFVAEVGAELPGGIYNVTVSARSKALARTVISSFAKLGEAAQVGLDKSESLAVSTWPNPVQDVLQVEVDLPVAQAAQVRLVNVYGQTLQTWNLAVQVGKQELQYAVGDLAAGVYLVELQQGHQKTIQKILVE